MEITNSCNGTRTDGLSPLGFGSLAVSRPQAAFSEDELSELLAYASARSINWLDTAEHYENYALLRKGLTRLGDRMKVFSKSYAWEAEAMRASVEKARQALNRDVIDLFMLHEQESVHTLRGHEAAFAALLEEKAKGRVAAVGVSTHAVSVVRAVNEAVRGETAGIWENDFRPSYQACDYLFALLNRSGIGLLDGSWQEMEAACRSAAGAGVSVLGMKVFAGGHLLQDRVTAVRNALAISEVRAWCVGMKNRDEIDMNSRLFSGRPVAATLMARSLSSSRRLLIADWCCGCGRCVERCKSGALRIENGRAVVDAERCSLCSYCAFACRDYCLKIV